MAEKTCYNIAKDAVAPMKGRKHTAKSKHKISLGTKGQIRTEEFKINLSITRMGENNPMFGMYGEKNPFFGKHHTKETLAELARVRLGTHHTEESKAKISIANSGENNYMYGKHHTEEAKLKISENHWDSSGEHNPMYGMSGEKAPSAKVTWKIAREIRVLYKQGNVIQKELMTLYSLSRSTIGSIINNKSWIEN